MTVGFGPGGAWAVAQDVGAEPHPAHIHRGTCDELGDVVFPLADVGAGLIAANALDATPGSVPAGEPAGSETAEPVEASVSTVDAPLTDIVEGGHAINVHESAENIDAYIACGDVGGRIVEAPELGDALLVGLRELDGSGYAGIAVLQDEGAHTRVSLYLARGLVGGGMADGLTGTPAAGGEDAGAADVAVDIEDFAYEPDPVTVAVGGTVTWTNRDRASHTATGLDRDVLDSGSLGQGESFDQRFDEAGTFAYRCAFHPTMKGTVVVE
jgi:plastocyanin